jgi:hypothetical protein
MKSMTPHGITGLERVNVQAEQHKAKLILKNE